jgi:MFS superfamily sulfate permease-like transporter
LSALLGYRFSDDFRHDAIAGLSVAAVALPVSIAYAQLAGFDPVVGLYSSILPLVAYAIFGTSRQLMVNPDAAACAMSPPLSRRSQTTVRNFIFRSRLH